MKRISVHWIPFALLLFSATWQSCSRENNLEAEGNTSIQSEPGSRIVISSAGYSKAELWIGKTQSVTWVNHDSKLHSVTADDGSFNSGAMQPGSSFTKEFNQPGVYGYHDKYSSARATINVFGRPDP